MIATPVPWSDPVPVMRTWPALPALRSIPEPPCSSTPCEALSPLAPSITTSLAGSTVPARITLAPKIATPVFAVASELPRICRPAPAVSVLPPSTVTVPAGACRRSPSPAVTATPSTDTPAWPCSVMAPVACSDACTRTRFPASAVRLAAAPPGPERLRASAKTMSLLAWSTMSLAWASSTAGETCIAPGEVASASSDTAV